MSAYDYIVKFDGLDDLYFKDRYFFVDEYKTTSELFDQETVTISFMVPNNRSKSVFKSALYLNAEVKYFNAEMKIGMYKFRLSCPESVHIKPVSRVTDSVTIVFKKLERLGEQKMNKMDSRVESFLQELFDEDTNKRESAHILTPKISNIYANEKKKTVVVKWQTGETTKVTCLKGDEWDLEKGIMAAITKYVLGNNYNAGNILNKYIKSVKWTD